ncbi:MAG: helix-turn-helix domain-containing protein [Gemmatimonadota bacterium]|nr:helix-turn-helix domain-containing protein [Gemmatimonadota bacterium]
MTRSAAEGAPIPALIVLLKRERARALVRSAFTRRRAHVIAVKTAAELGLLLVQQLIDGVIVDSGFGDDGARALAMAADFPTVPFFLVTPLLPQDSPTVARSVEGGVAELLVEALDDSAARDLVLRRSFSWRFERALFVPPPVLALDTPLQIAVWQSVVRRSGRPVRTDQLARELGVSREHLSRSFAVGQAPTLKRVIDLVRVIAAAELSKNPGFDVRDVAVVLGFASSSHLSGTSQRLVGARASSLTRLRTVDLLDRFASMRERDEHAGDTEPPDVS